MNVTTRRDFCKGATLATVAGGLAGSIIVDPHADLLVRWRHASKAWRSEFNRADEDTPASEAIWRHRDELRRRVLETRPRTFSGAAALLAFIIEDSDGDYVYQGHEEGLRLLAEFMKDRIAITAEEGIA
ncbi:twin-arginine translocation signal domain-containing protein [Salipiger sp. PrR003]|uniref:twin-arginine translocation signal domain-containing protein n=1 Tax=Salipiger sp. PrR003 TaxID=2706776 RepID=UPI0013D90390|nr:twin-arginine translocation signal domain-containing protein [Salipiger sp. PrR003]NDV52155.1 twin-arginine translocation signal domain-containing protein [Salipiger sp. PrR003]NDV52181.1 twin-arginine translocation signal domain-containing protein [Salipiger sp. PrR003]